VLSPHISATTATIIEFIVVPIKKPIILPIEKGVFLRGRSGSDVIRCSLFEETSGSDHPRL
jgi:hypothetical protein